MSNLRNDENVPWGEWDAAARRDKVSGALDGLFEKLANDITKEKPVCASSGKCCKFDTYGHRLYVTGLEIAYVLVNLEAENVVRLLDAKIPEMDGCPFQVEGLCGVHGVRPLGCRIYYCDPDSQAWQSPAYEQYLSDIRSLHELEGLPYSYMEWRLGLAQAREALGAKLKR